MWSKLSHFFLLALLGAVCGQWIDYNDDNDDPEEIVQIFMKKMERAAKSHNTTAIGEMLHYEFRMYGCHSCVRGYNRYRFAEAISEIPFFGDESPFYFHSVEENETTISFFVSIPGFGKSDIEASFFLNTTNRKLQSVNVFKCLPFSEFVNTFRAEASIENIVNKFLTRMRKALESKEPAVIDGLFQTGFRFRGCKGVYRKNQTVALLTQIPTDTKFAFVLKSYKDNGASIKYTVSVTGFGESEISANFVLNKADQQLESGVVPACQDPHFHRFVAQDSAQLMTEKFIARAFRSIRSKDKSIISGLFQSEFLFKGCKGTYNKKQIVDVLAQNPADATLVFNLKPVQDNGDTIAFTVFGISPVVADFILNKKDQKLVSGKMSHCQGKNGGLTTHHFLHEDHRRYCY